MNVYVRSLAIVALTWLPTVAVSAEPILDYLPENTVGFLLVRNLADTNVKIERVAKIFQEASPMPIPAPLPVLKAATGLGAGLNEQGDAVLALLPGDERAAAPRPLFLVPVSDYAAFAASVNGDSSGEICRVTIAGEDVLVARRGAYAALMNVEHRERFEELLTSEPKPIESIAPLREWLAKTNVAAVLTPTGVDMLTALGRATQSGQNESIDEQLSEPQFAGALQSVRRSFAFYEFVMGFFGYEVSAAAAGIAIDDATNVKLLSQVALAKNGEPAKIPPSPVPTESPLAGYSDQPIVLAAGGPLPPGSVDAIAKFSRQLVEADPKVYGFENLTERQWKDVEDSWRDAMAGLQKASVMVLPGDEDDPLLSNLYSILKVEDAQKYLDSNAKSVETWNQLMSRSTSDIKLKYETTQVNVSGKKALLMSTNVAEAAGDPNVPAFTGMLDAMFGEDGKLKLYFVAADDQTVIMGVSEEDEVAAVLKQVLAVEQGLAESASVKKAVALLDPQAPWLGVVSPKGCVMWLARYYNKFLAQFGQGVPAIPEYPDSPPLAFSLQLAEGRLSGEVVWPAETLGGLAVYIKRLQDSF